MSAAYLAIKSKLNVVRYMMGDYLTPDQRQELNDAIDTIMRLASIATAKKDLET